MTEVHLGVGLDFFFFFSNIVGRSVGRGPLSRGPAPIHVFTPIDLTFEVVPLHHVVLMCIMLYECHIFTILSPIKINDIG